MKSFDPDQIFLDDVIDDDGYWFYIPSRLICSSDEEDSDV